jgi:hypothetical protein
MSKQDEYREAALASLQIAGAASNHSERLRMLLLADAWFKLAERTTQSTLVSEHSLVPEATRSTVL